MLPAEVQQPIRDLQLQTSLTLVAVSALAGAAVSAALLELAAGPRAMVCC
jgi:hypothetical protein